MDKKGVSAIITTMLVVVLVLVAVGIVWGVMRNILKGSSEEIDLGKLTLSLEITDVVVTAGVSIVVKVERNPGAGKLTSIRFIVDDGTSKTVFDEASTMAELEDQTFTLAYTDPLPLEISIVPVLESTSGSEILGSNRDTYEIN